MKMCPSKKPSVGGRWCHKTGRDCWSEPVGRIVAVCKLFPELRLKRPRRLSHLLRDMHVPLGLQGQAPEAAVEHSAWAVVAKLTSVVFLSPEAAQADPVSKCHVKPA